MDKLDAVTDVAGITALAAMAIFSGLEPDSVVTGVIALAGVRAGKEGGS